MAQFAVVKDGKIESIGMLAPSMVPAGAVPVSQAEYLELMQDEPNPATVAAIIGRAAL